MACHPWFPFFPADWRDVKVQSKSLEAQGLYINLLAIMWKDFYQTLELPYDVQLLSRLVGQPPWRIGRLLSELIDGTLPVFQKRRRAGNIYLVSNKLQEVQNRAEHFRSLQAEKGRKSAEARRQPRLNRGSTGVQPQNNHNRTRTRKNIRPLDTQGLPDFKAAKEAAQEALKKIREVKE